MDECARMEQAIRPVRSSGRSTRPPPARHHRPPRQRGPTRRRRGRAGNFTGAFVARAVHLYHHGADEIWRPVVAFELGAADGAVEKGRRWTRSRRCGRGFRPGRLCGPTSATARPTAACSRAASPISPSSRSSRGRLGVHRLRPGAAQQPRDPDQIRDAINGQPPGFVQDANGKNGIIPISAFSGAALSVMAIVGSVGLIWAAWLALAPCARASVRSSAPRIPAALCAGAAAQVRGAPPARRRRRGSGRREHHRQCRGLHLCPWIGIGDQAWVVTVVGPWPGAGQHALVALMLRVLSGVDSAWAGLRNGAIFGGGYDHHPDLRLPPDRQCDEQSIARVGRRRGRSAGFANFISQVMLFVGLRGRPMT